MTLGCAELEVVEVPLLCVELLETWVDDEEALLLDLTVDVLNPEE